MKLITTAHEMSEFSRSSKEQGNQVRFIPTMGALHKGHLSLVQQAKSDGGKIVVSVFVNPTQFNELSDLKNYPRTLEADSSLLQSENVDVLFFPSVEEIYPLGKGKTYNLDGLDSSMEGPNRPGHFNGVVEVVTRLFDIVQPSSAYFGEKDFQQLAVIRHMTNKLGYKCNIVGCKTVREANGLAMSSRNTRLSEDGKKTASIISKCLNETKTKIQEGVLINDIATTVSSKLETTNGITLEYFELVDSETLLPAEQQTVNIQACIAAWVDDVRLIDNMQVK